MEFINGLAWLVCGIYIGFYCTQAYYDVEHRKIVKRSEERIADYEQIMGEYARFAAKDAGKDSK